MKWMLWVGCVIAVLLLLGGCTRPGLEKITLESKTGDKQTFYVEIADSLDEWTQGLMYRDSLPEDQGMLFIFQEEAEKTFWMKNTLIPLTITFYDKEGHYVHSVDAVPCKEDPCELYHSFGEAMYVLEVPKGALVQGRYDLVVSSFS